MSAIDFPTSPTNNQEFSGYRYSSAKGAWLKIKDPITLTYIGDSAPSSPFNGQVWFNSALGITSVYYDDGDTSQWLEIVEAGAQGPTGPAGNVVLNISGTSPSGPTSGQIWYDSDDGKLYFYYTDVDSSQWVEIASTVGSTGPTGPTGPGVTTGKAIAMALVFG